MNASMEYELKRDDFKNLTAVIAEDQAPMRKAIARVLLSMGFKNVVEFSNGRDIREYIEENPVHIVLSDLNMPEEDGFALIENIRSRDINSDIPIILVSGEAAKEDIIRAVDLGASEYLVKPFVAEDLERKVKSILSVYLNPPEKLRLYRLAEAMIQKKDFSQAKQAIALIKDEGSVKQNYLLAVIEAKERNYNEALNYLYKNTLMNENHYKTHALLADILLATNQVKKAAEAMIKELSLNARQPKRHTQLGALNMQLGLYDDALESFRNALKENVRYQEALFSMAQLYLFQKNLDKAIYYLKRIRRNDPTNGKALSEIIDACIASNDEKKAEYILKDEIKQSKSKQLDAIFYLGKLYMQTGRTEEAKDIVLQLHKLAATSYEYNYLNAKLAMLESRYSEAKNALEVLIKDHPSFDLKLDLADAHFGSGQIKSALQMLFEIVQLKPTLVVPKIALCLASTDQHAKTYFSYLILTKQRPLSKAEQAAELTAKNALMKRRRIPSAA
jgi:DNA-binding response OmpR family regulator/Tfp pilus assembly protein PilF